MREISMRKQRKGGLLWTIAGGLVICAVVCAFVVFHIDTYSDWAPILALIVGFPALGMFLNGLSILFTGALGAPNVHYYCPYCNTELSSGDMPTPGYVATCPHCGKTFGRSDW